MALRDKIGSDNRTVFQNVKHFSEKHTWNGIPFYCVTDETTAIKRKNNNVADISWDNNKTETTIYVVEGDFPGHLTPNERGFFDRKSMRILQINTDCGMVTITMCSEDAKGVIV